MITITLFSNAPTEKYEVHDAIITSRRVPSDDGYYCTTRIELIAAPIEKAISMEITIDTRWVAVTLCAAEHTTLLLDSLFVRIDKHGISLHFEGDNEELAELREMLMVLNGEYRKYIG